MKGIYKMKLSKLDYTEVSNLLTKISKKTYPLVADKEDVKPAEWVDLYLKNCKPELIKLKQMGMNGEVLANEGFFIACLCQVHTAIARI